MTCANNLMTQLSVQCFGSRAEGITDHLLLPGAWPSLLCAGVGAGHIPGTWAGRRLLLIHEKRWMELCVLCQRSSDGQLFLPVCKYRSQAVQDILDNEAQFICCLNRLVEKLLSFILCPKGKIKDVLPTWQNWSLHMLVLKVPTPRSWGWRLSIDFRVIFRDFI